MIFARTHRLYILGAVLLVTLVICAHNFESRGAASFLIPLGIGGAGYLLAFRELLSAPTFPRRVVVIGLALAAIWQIAFLLRPTGADDDIRRYVWDGHIQRHGLNPYLVDPNDPTLVGLLTPETKALNHPDLPSPYPPAAELFFRAVTAIHESVFALKVAFLLCDWAIVFVLLDVLRRSRVGEHWVLAYAWHPLLATEAVGSGHVDILGALLLVISLAALLRRWRTSAAVSFALAVAVKFLPIVLLPLLWKRIRIRDGALAAIAFGLLYIPFLNHGHIPTGSLAVYVQIFRFNDPVFTALEHAVSPSLLIGIAAAVGFAASCWLRRNKPAESSEAFAWPMAASLVIAPVIYPWYLLWVVPFLRSASTLPIVVWTVSIIPTYVVWHLRTMGQPWVLPTWVWILEYGCVAVTGAVVLLRSLQMRWSGGAPSD